MSKYPLLKAIEESRREFIKVIGKQPDYVRLHRRSYARIRIETARLMKEQGGPAVWESWKQYHVSNLSGVDIVVAGPDDPPFEHYCIEAIEDESLHL